MTTQRHKISNRRSRRLYSKAALGSDFMKGSLLKEVSFSAPAMNSNGLLLRFGARYYQIDQLDIAYIYSRESVNVLVTRRGDRIPIHHSMIKLTDILDQRRFTRMAKDLIVSIDAIKGMIYKRGRGLMIKLFPDLGLKFTYDHNYDRKPFDFSLISKNIDRL